MLAKTPRISVCMATYDGEDWVERQLLSILDQIGSDDEVIVVDDDSRDGTVRIIKDLGDSRISIHQNNYNVGHVRSFERAISLASGDIVLLSDQDDVWLPQRVSLFVDALQQHAVVASSLDIVDVANNWLEGFRLRPKSTRHSFQDIFGLFLGRRAYFGCAMGFNRDVANTLLPFPIFTEAHDHWLAVTGAFCGGIGHISAPTVARTIHGRNLSVAKRRPIARIFVSRLKLLYLVAAAACRKFRVST